MNKETNERPSQVVYIVTCYQNIIGVYASHDDACAMQNDLVLKNRPADVLCRVVVQPLNAE